VGRLARLTRIRTLQLAGVPAAIVLALSAAGCGHAPAVEEQSLLRAEPATQELPALLLGELTRGTTAGRDVQARFVIKNDSAQPQRLKFVGTSCYCAGLLRHGKKLKNGAELEIAAGGRETVEIVAHVVPQVQTHSFCATLVPQEQTGADPLELRFFVPVIADVKFTPEVVLHEFVAKGAEPVEHRVRIERTIRSATSPREECRKLVPPNHVQLVRIEQVAPPRKIEPGLWRVAWNATLKIDSDQRLQGVGQPGTAVVTFTEGNHVTRTAPLPVILRRRFGIEAARDVHLGFVAPGESRTRKLLISAADQRKFAVRSVHSTSREISAGTTALDGARHWVDITYHAAQSGKLRSEVELETDHPDCPKLIIHVTGTCQTNSARLAEAGED